MRYHHRSLPLLLALMLVIGVAPAFGVAASPQPRAETSSRLTTAENYAPDAEECKFLTLINEYRASKGVGKLKLMRGLGAASEHHSVDMAQKNYFSHTMKDGTTVAQNIQNHGNGSYNRGWGENIAAGRATAAETFEQWRTSPGHNANMLDGDFTNIGIGRAYGANSRYGWYWTTVFGVVADTEVTTCSSASSTPTPTPEPAKKLTVSRVTGTVNSDYPEATIDGSTATSWRSKPITPLRAGVTFDLGSSKMITSIKWTFSYSGNADAYRIRVSNDGTTWTTIGRFTNGQDSWRTLNWEGKARYVRFSFSNPQYDSVIGYLGEVQFWQ